MSCFISLILKQLQPQNYNLCAWETFALIISQSLIIFKSKYFSVAFFFKHLPSPDYKWNKCHWTDGHTVRDCYVSVWCKWFNQLMTDDLLVLFLWFSQKHHFWVQECWMTSTQEEPEDKKRFLGKTNIHIFV